MGQCQVSQLETCELDMRMLHAVALTMEKLPWDKGMGSAWLRFPILSSAAVSVDIRCK